MLAGTQPSSRQIAGTLRSISANAAGIYRKARPLGVVDVAVHALNSMVKLGRPNPIRIA